MMRARSIVHTLITHKADTQITQQTQQSLVLHYTALVSAEPITSPAEQPLQQRLHRSFAFYQ